MIYLSEYPPYLNDDRYYIHILFGMLMSFSISAYNNVCLSTYIFRMDISIGKIFASLCAITVPEHPVKIWGYSDYYFQRYM